MMSIDKPTMSDIIDGVKKSKQSSEKLPNFEPIGLSIELEGKFYDGIPVEDFKNIWEPSKDENAFYKIINDFVKSLSQLNR